MQLSDELPELSEPCSSPRPSKQSVPKIAISSFETIRNASVLVMLEHQRLHHLIEHCYMSLLKGESYSGGVAEKQEVNDKQDEPNTNLQETSGHSWKQIVSPQCGHSLLPVGNQRPSLRNVGEPRSPIFREKPQWTANNSTSGSRNLRTEDSGLPEFVKTFSDSEPPWSHRHINKVCENTAQTHQSEEIDTSATNPSLNSNFTRNLANDFAMAQGWIMPTTSMDSVHLKPVGKLVNGPSFDSWCAVVIITNSLLMAVATDYGANNKIASETDLPMIFRIMDYMFSAWFLLELLLRIGGAGPCMFWSFKCPAWTWNYFDTVVVTLNVVDIVMRMFNAKGFGANATALRTVRVLRVAKAMRIVRLFRFFRTLRMMVLSILSSFTALFWAMVLLAIIMLTFAIFLTQNVSNYLYEDGLPVMEKQHAGKLKDFFGTLIHTVYYLYLSVSGGISWGEVSAPLFHIDTSNGLLFCFYIFASVFAMLNIITGIFLDTAIRAAQADKDESIAEQLHSEDSTIRSLQTIFKDADKDQSGEISAEEFDAHLVDVRVRAHLASLGIEAGKASALFRLLDLDSSGSITVDEFLFGCMRIRGGAKGLDVATLLYENKRLVHKWSIFMAYVEKEFKSRKRFEQRLDDKIHRLLHWKLSHDRHPHGSGSSMLSHERLPHGSQEHLRQLSAQGSIHGTTPDYSQLSSGLAQLDPVALFPHPEGIRSL